MRKEYILGILFFSAIWGISEAFLGGVLYSPNVNIPYPSVWLTIIGFSVLAFARASFPQIGTATLIASLAMLFKFLNTPFHMCHLLGILMVGICFDLFFNVLKLKNRSISAAASVYLNFTAFAIMMTYIARSEYWGISKLLSHIGISGTIAALGCAIFVPISFLLAERIKSYSKSQFNLQYKLAPGSVLVTTLGLWIYSIVVFGL